MATMTPRFDPVQIPDLLQEVAARLQLPCADGFCDRVIMYLRLLEKWNKVYNLTSLRSLERMFYGHIIDSMSVVPHLAGPRILDVGTGPGLPGVVVAMLKPDWELVLLDSNQRKLNFVTQAVAELGLRGVRVVCQRVESFVSDQGFDTIVSRAFCSFPEMKRVAGGLLNGRGRLVMMKGKMPDQELDAVQLADGGVSVIPLEVPCLEAERHLIVFDAGESVTA